MNGKLTKEQEQEMIAAGRGLVDWMLKHNRERLSIYTSFDEALNDRGDS